MIQRIAVLVVAAVAIGAGTMLFTTSSRALMNEHRINTLEQAVTKIPDIDRNVLILNGKLDVLNQKMDDAKSALEVRGPQSTTTTTTTKVK